LPLVASFFTLAEVTRNKRPTSSAFSTTDKVINVPLAHAAEFVACAPHIEQERQVALGCGVRCFLHRISLHCICPHEDE
jgi:hypothetical protein